MDLPLRGRKPIGPAERVHLFSFGDVEDGLVDEGRGEGLVE